jgi:hypothetical protein
MMEEHGRPVNHAVRDACSHSFGPVFLAASASLYLVFVWFVRGRPAIGGSVNGRRPEQQHRSFEEIHLTAGTIGAR